jgi:hypothetical protein
VHSLTIGSSSGSTAGLFYVACLLHDAGLTTAVTGEDFTLRSAAVAADVVRDHRPPADVERLRDSVTAHTTPGATVAHDGAVAFYVHAGATCDLAGFASSTSAVASSTRS